MNDQFSCLIVVNMQINVYTTLTEFLSTDDEKLTKSFILDWIDNTTYSDTLLYSVSEIIAIFIFYLELFCRAYQLSLAFIEYYGSNIFSEL